MHFPRLNSAIFVETDIFLDLEDALNLNGTIVGKGGQSNCAPGSHTLLRPKHLKIFCLDFFSDIVNLHHEIGESVDDGDAL